MVRQVFKTSLGTSSSGGCRPLLYGKRQGLVELENP